MKVDKIGMKTKLFSCLKREETEESKENYSKFYNFYSK